MTPARLVAEMCAGLHGWSGRRRVVVVLWAYFDESGSHQQSEVFTLAGLVSTAKRWEHFSAAWLRTLRRFGLTSPFHTQECMNRRGQFKDWPEDRRIRLLQELARLIKAHIICGVSSSVLVRDFEEVMNAPDDEDEGTYPYVFCLQSCLEEVSARVARPGEGIACMFERIRGVEADATKFFYYLQSSKTWEDTFRTIAFGSAVDFVPLQAADLIAYENYKFVLQQVAHPGELPIRKFYRLLDQSKVFHFGYYDRRALSVTMHGIRQIQESTRRDKPLIRKLSSALRGAEERMHADRGGRRKLAP